MSAPGVYKALLQNIKRLIDVTYNVLQSTTDRPVQERERLMLKAVVRVCDTFLQVGRSPQFA